MMTKKILLLMVSLAGLKLSAQQEAATITENGYTEGQRSALLSGQSLENMNEGAIKYFPKSALLSSTVAGQINSLSPELTIETVSYVKAPTADRLSLFNNMLKLSTLSGLEYETSKNKMEVLVSGASVLSSATSSSASPDPELSERPRTYTLYMRQTDSLWGTINYQVDYFTQGDEVAMIMTNMDSMKQQKIFTFADKAAFKTVIYFVPAEEGYLIYTASFNRKVGNKFGSKSSLYDTLLRRLDAYATWFNTLYPRESGN